MSTDISLTSLNIRELHILRHLKSAHFVSVYVFLLKISGGLLKSDALIWKWKWKLI